jgi:hypothetical protein
LNRVFEHLPFGKRHDAGSNGEESTLESRAVRFVREFLYAHAANLKRATRLEEKAERLEEAGIPGESARNRAERAHGEVLPGAHYPPRLLFRGIRPRRARAFDRALKILYPTFASSLRQAFSLKLPLARC